MRWKITTVLVLVLLAPAPGVRAQQRTYSEKDRLRARELPDWWSDRWAYRLRVTIPVLDARAMARGGKPTSTAQVPGIRFSGRCNPDGSDLRLVDHAGDPINFRIVDIDPYGDTLLQVQTPPGVPLTAWLYFGNSNAFPIATEKANEFAPPWKPEGMIETRIYRKKKPGHPKTLAELKKMIGEAGRPEVVKFDNRVRYTHNPYGESDHYILAMDGDLRIDQTGEYKFAVYADDGCWVLIDGKTYVNWPGPRPEDFNIHKGKHFAVALEKGVHRFELYQEEGTGGQQAYIRWLPPGASVLNEPSWDIWLMMRHGMVDLMQARDKPLVADFRAWSRNSFWIPETERQLNWVAARDNSYSFKGKVVKWQLETDDGMVRTSAVNQVEHVFFANGLRTLKFTVTDDKGNSDTAVQKIRLWQVNVESEGDLKRGEDPVQGLSGRRRSIPYQTYYLLKMEQSPEYECPKMSEPDLVNYAVFWDTFDNAPRVLEALDALTVKAPKRLDDPKLADIGARAAMTAGLKLGLAEKLLRKLATDTKDPYQKLKRTLQHANLLTWAQGKSENARETAAKIRKSLTINRKVRSDPKAQAVLRYALIVEGDALLLLGKYDEAKKTYEEAEKLDLPVNQMSGAEKAARKGSYPFTVEDYLSRDMITEAIEAIQEWERLMPSSKMEGMCMYLRGKALFMIKPSDLAVRYLGAAEDVNPRGSHAPEAGWLKANCLFKLDKIEEAALAYMKIRDNFSRARYLQRVNRKIKECQKILAKTNPELKLPE